MDELVQNLQVLSLENTAATIQTNCVGSLQIIAPSSFRIAFKNKPWMKMHLQTLKQPRLLQRSNRVDCMHWKVLDKNAQSTTMRLSKTFKFFVSSCFSAKDFEIACSRQHGHLFLLAAVKKF
jgi:hypothetical protein